MGNRPHESPACVCHGCLEYDLIKMIAAKIGESKRECPIEDGAIVDAIADLLNAALPAREPRLISCGEVAGLPGSICMMFDVRFPIVGDR